MGHTYKHIHTSWNRDFLKLLDPFNDCLGVQISKLALFEWPVSYFFLGCAVQFATQPTSETSTFYQGAPLSPVTMHVRGGQVRHTEMSCSVRY